MLLKFPRIPSSRRLYRVLFLVLIITTVLITLRPSSLGGLHLSDLKLHLDQFSSPAFQDYSSNRSHLPIPSYTDQYHGASLNPLPDVYTAKEINKDNVSRFMSKVIDIVKQDPYIRQLRSFNNNKHYYKQKKKGHFSGPVKESFYLDPVYSSQYLSTFLTISDEEISKLSNSHRYIINNLLSLEEDENIYNNENGYVYMGGTIFDYLNILSLLSLRKSGSKLPVEIMVPFRKDINKQICDEVYPKFNARCVIMEDFKFNLNKFQKYQFKSLALLLNSFENVLLLDSDNMVLENPDYLFTNEPFTSKGLIIWPDLWRRTTSPTFYNIAGIKVTANRIRNSYWHLAEIPDRYQASKKLTPLYFQSFHDYEGTIQESSSESGQLMINKRTHLKTLLLSFYYNYHGPKFYYPLLTQNSHGEGDKETVIAAAHVLDEPFYQLEEWPKDFHKEHDSIRFGSRRSITAIGQYNAIIDYNNSMKPLELDDRNRLGDFNYSNPDSNWEFKTWNSSQLLFLHCNWPKLYPYLIMNGKGSRNFLNESGQRERLYPGLIEELKGRDFELEIIEFMKYILCQHYQHLSFPAIKKSDYKKYCGQLNYQQKFLKKYKY